MHKIVMMLWQLRETVPIISDLDRDLVGRVGHGQVGRPRDTDGGDEGLGRIDLKLAGHFSHRRRFVFSTTENAGQELTI